jgi:hypothetical protein
MMLAPTERHAALHVSFAAVLPRHLVVDLTVPDGHHAADDDTARMAGRDLLALVLAVAAPGPPEVQSHPSGVHLLLALDVVLPTETSQGAEADRARAFEFCRNLRAGLAAHDDRQLGLAFYQNSEQMYDFRKDRRLRPSVGIVAIASQRPCR